MSDELKLPGELAACEARLAALPLAGARIDRDKLMFRAGWSAGHAAVLSLPLKGRKHWRSHLATAAVAASLAFAATLGFTPQGMQVVPSEAPSVRPSAADALPSSFAKQSSGATRAQSFAEFDDLLDGRHALTRGAPLMARQRFTINFVATQVELDDPVPPARPATARRLLEDLAPREKSGASPHEPGPAWPWSRLLGGNTI